MTRKKVKLAYITNDSSRKATFKKRKKGLLKKVSELSTLCDIKTCAIIYSPYDTQPEVWPSPMEVQNIIAKFKMMPEMDQSKKMVNQESFLRQRIAKSEEQLKKQQRDNREKEMTQVMYRSLVGEGLQNLNIVDLNDLGWVIDKSIKEIDEKIKSLLEQQAVPPPPPPPPPAAAPAPQVQDMFNDEAAARNTNTDLATDSSQNQQWLMDLLKSNDNMGFGRNDDMLPYSLHTNNFWSNFPFP
ncbi:agamous-like MADS-box protein AGL80 [Quercus robur]|uniref:agamous-like MADS-box protein AGL80 n=1 Tax=Quercus robur TaxID=38942 RepID=UPI0021616FFD|nr:agamous-like MADS-box protein AGL80 [Quercus robur]